MYIMYSLWCVSAAKCVLLYNCMIICDLCYLCDEKIFFLNFFLRLVVVVFGFMCF
jgi:intracellular septation protein A